MKKISITKFLAIPMLAGLLAVSTVSLAGDYGTKSSDAGGRLSIGLEVGLPMGDFGDGAGVGFGGSLRYEMPLAMNLALTGTAGYITFGGKDGGKSSGMIPIQLGGKFYFSEQQNGFYAALELGVHMYSYTIPGYDAVIYNGVTLIPAQPDETKTSTYFSYAPGIGYHLSSIDLGVRYQIVSGDGGSLSYLGLRLAYAFGGK